MIGWRIKTPVRDSTQDRSFYMEKVGDILSVNGKTVNSKYKSLTTVNSNTVNSNVWEEVENLIQIHNIKPEGIAKHIAEQLSDEKSLHYYSLLVKEHSYEKLFEAMYLTVESWKNGKIRTSKPIYFIAILRHWGFRTNFKEDKS